jgi:hypothetical protein
MENERGELVDRKIDSFAHLNIVSVVSWYYQLLPKLVITLTHSTEDTLSILKHSR